MDAVGQHDREVLEANSSRIGASGKIMVNGEVKIGTIFGSHIPILSDIFDRIVESHENIRRHHGVLIAIPSSSRQYVSTIVCKEETLQIITDTGFPIRHLLKNQGVLCGVNAHRSIEVMDGTNGETITLGLGSFAQRCRLYYECGVRFAIWHVKFKIGPTEPSSNAIDANVGSLAEFAMICQTNGLVPVIRLEILVSGAHSIDACAKVTMKVFGACCTALVEERVFLEGTVLIANMVTPGDSADMVTPDVVAKHTIQALRYSVLPAVGSIVFMAGDDVNAELNLIALFKMIKKVKECDQRHIPWSLSSSLNSNLDETSSAFLTRCEERSKMMLGTYKRD